MTLHFPKSLLTSICTTWAVGHAVAVDSSNIPWGSEAEVEVFRYGSDPDTGTEGWYYGAPIGDKPLTDWNNGYEWVEAGSAPDSFGSTIVLLDGYRKESIKVDLEISGSGGLVAINNTNAEVDTGDPNIGYIYVEEGSCLRITGSNTYTPALTSDSYSLVANGSLTFCCNESLTVGPTKWFIGKNGSVTCDENLATINIADESIDPFTIVAETIGCVENREAKERVVFSSAKDSSEGANNKFTVKVVDINGRELQSGTWGDENESGENILNAGEVENKAPSLKFGVIDIQPPGDTTIPDSVFGVVLKDDYSETEQATLVWQNAESKKWVQGGSGWYKEGDAGKTDTGFLNGDKVVFEKVEGESGNNVTLGGDVAFDTMAVRGNTNIKADSHQLRGKEVSLSNGVTLTVENAGLSGIRFATEEEAVENGTVNIVAGKLLGGSVGVVDSHDSKVENLDALMSKCTLKNTDVVITAAGAIDAKAIGVEDFSSKTFALNIMSDTTIEAGASFTLTLEGMENYKNVVLHWAFSSNNADGIPLSLENTDGIKIDLDTNPLGQIENYTGAPVVFTSQNGTVVDVWATCNVPEPTTGTLSVLALAALCARRRRKK